VRILLNIFHSKLTYQLETIVGFKVDLVSKKGIKEKYLKSIDSDLIYV